MADPFDSAWLKWGWAVKHAQAFQKDLGTHSKNADPESFFTSRTEYNAKSHCVIMRVDTIQPLPARWGLAVGDIANNFRASLDHLAWALVRRGTAPRLKRNQERNIYFPIAREHGKFESACRSLPGLRRTDKAIIRRYQPYVRGRRNLWRHCLTPLPDLTRKDKHQEIRPVLTIPESGTVYVGEAQDCTITLTPERARRRAFEIDAEIHRVYVRKCGPNPDVYMEAKFVAKVTLDGRILLEEWLAQTTTHIGRLLLEFSEQPDELHKLGIVGDMTPYQRTTPAKE